MKEIDTDILVVGAGPVGLFTAFEAGLLGLKTTIVDSLDRPGGQCIELYPEKPIYDIPGVPNQTAREHVDALLKQIEPFDPEFHLAQTVTSIEQYDIGKMYDRHFTGFKVKTTAGTVFNTPNVFIAAGAGNFVPRKPDVPGIEEFEGIGLDYAVRSKENYRNKRLVIFGGGDSALDWTVDLADIAKEITLIHRRPKYRAAPHTVEAARAKENVKEVTGELRSVHRAGQGGEVEHVVVADKEGNESVVACDKVLIFYGLSVQLGPIADWGLDIHEDRKINVDTEKFETNVPGVFAVGDINNYPGKLDLILSGFHETTLAVQEAFKRARPGEKLKFQYTTSSSDLQKKLGVK